MLTITILRKQEEGRWHSDGLKSLPDKVSNDDMLWVDVQDLSSEQAQILIERFDLDETDLELAKDGAV